ncbi:Protein CBG14999 [Caenorhabditis briggsae]|uniref:Protein CBG14999 n=1 Tax=Caenorhabditis briggsae TaxID=6238 RepID=A8XL65_CAEBR|nr:Protein CBG14999 [Caenorhabditis briggsae]CAP33390.2 Protein CBG14999 [Caenorhabditis briggsae]
MSNANHRVTGTEKALVCKAITYHCFSLSIQTFETRLVALAMSAEHLTGVASAIILSVHVLYQLMVSYLLNQSREDMRRIDKQRTSGPNDA